MLVKCMYCGIIIDSIGKTEGTSHGVCSDCLPKILDDLGISLIEYLENMMVPAGLMGNDNNRQLGYE